MKNEEVKISIDNKLIIFVILLLIGVFVVYKYNEGISKDEIDKEYAICMYLATERSHDFRRKLCFSDDTNDCSEKNIELLIKYLKEDQEKCFKTKINSQ